MFFGVIFHMFLGFFLCLVLLSGVYRKPEKVMFCWLFF